LLQADQLRAPIGAAENAEAFQEVYHGTFLKPGYLNFSPARADSATVKINRVGGASTSEGCTAPGLSDSAEKADVVGGWAEYLKVGELGVNVGREHNGHGEYEAARRVVA